MVPCAPVILIIVWLKSEVSITLRCWLCSTRFTAVWIKNCLKSTSANKLATMKNTDDFCYEGKPSRATTFCQKREWDTKEDTGKSMKNTLHILRYAKRHLSSWSDVQQWKNQACSLSCYRGTLVWRHQSVTQAVENLLNKYFFKIS